jgi:hypothetical protein
MGANTKHLLIGVAVAVGAYMLYRQKTLPQQIVNNAAGQPVSQKLGANFDLGDPWLYAVAAAGAIGGRLLG